MIVNYKYDINARLKRIALFLMAGTILITCKKEPLPQSSVNGQPVFSFVGTINSNSVNWQAGVNNYYMYSSYSQDTVLPGKGVYSFIGTLQSTASNKNSIEIKINDDMVIALGAQSDINKSVTPVALYSYGGPGVKIDTTGYTVTFTPVIYSGTPVSYNYIFGDGGTSSATAPTHTYTTTAIYNTSLTVNFASCGTTTITNPVSIQSKSPPLTVNSVTSAITYKSLNKDTTKILLSTSVTGGTSPYSYSWNLGDGNTYNSASPIDKFIDSTHSTYSCALTVTDHVHISATYNYVIAVDSNAPICRFDYSSSLPIFVKDTVHINPYSLSMIDIIYTDGAGMVMESKNGPQTGSTFQVNSVVNYKNNTNNQATIILNVTFNCNVYSLGNPTPTIISGTAIIAVAYH